jgi:hypothetical protein
MYPSQKDYEIYIASNSQVEFNQSLYEKDKDILSLMKTLFCKDIDLLLQILDLQKDTAEIPGVQALFRTLFNSGMFHLQKVSKHMSKIKEDNEYILKSIEEKIAEYDKRD